jgi:hypothetical protein
VAADAAAVVAKVIHAFAVSPDHRRERGADRSRWVQTRNEVPLQTANGSMALRTVYGVWLSDRPLYWRGRDDGAPLEVTIYASDGFLDQYEW